MHTRFLRVHCWAQRFDYEALAQLAAAGHNFNTHAAPVSSRTHAHMTVLNYAVGQLPREPSANAESIIALVFWLIAHGADPTTKDAWAGHDMMETLEHARRDARGTQHASIFDTLHRRLTGP